MRQFHSSWLRSLWLKGALFFSCSLKHELVNEIHIYWFGCSFLILCLITQWLLLILLFFYLICRINCYYPEVVEVHFLKIISCALSAKFYQLVNANPKDHLVSDNSIKLQIAFTRNSRVNILQNSLGCHWAEVIFLAQQLSSAVVCMDFHQEDRDLQFWN